MHRNTPEPNRESWVRSVPVLFDLPESPAAFTAAHSARVYSTVTWLCDQVCAVAAGLIDSIPTPRTKVSLSVAARVFAWHADQWRALIPESVLLEDDRRAAPGPAARKALADLAGAEPLVRERSLRALVHEMRDEIDRLTARLSPVSDGAAARLATVLHADLGRLSEALEG
jgi:hypothetical protein